MCRNVMQVARARCPDCGDRLEVPFNWCEDPEFRGFLDPRAAERQLLEHARQVPILHPTLLAAHHLTRRTA